MMKESTISDAKTPRRKEWRDPEGSIIRRKVKRRDSKGRLKETELIFARVRFTDREGRRREKKRIAASISDAVILRRQLRLEIAAEAAESVVVEKPKTFNEVLDYFEAEFVKPAVIVGGQKIEGCKEDLTTIRRQIDLFRQAFGQRLIESIRYDDLRRFKLNRLAVPVEVEFWEKVPLTPEERSQLPTASRRRFRRVKQKKSSERKFASVHRELSRLKRVFSVAVRQGWIAANPFSLGEPLIKASLEATRTRIASFDEETRLLTACTGKRDHLKPIITLAIDSAMRRGEIFKLRWSDVDFENRRIFVPATNSKTGKSRFVPMTARVIEHLIPLRSFGGDEDRVFGIATNAGNAWNSAVAAAGIEGLRFHDLRATAITRLLRAGLGEAEVMKISGHSQYSTFMKYVRQDTDGSANAADKMDDYLKSRGGDRGN